MPRVLDELLRALTKAGVPRFAEAIRGPALAWVPRCAISQDGRQVLEPRESPVGWRSILAVPFRRQDRLWQPKA